MEYSYLGHKTSSSDDENVFRKVKIKEMKPRFDREKHRQTISCILSYSSEEDRSLQIIEAKSEPDLLKDIPKVNIDVENPPTISSNPNEISNLSLGNDDSLLQLETMVSELSTSAEGDDKTAPELDNTLEIIECILKNGQEKKSVETNTNAIQYTGTVSTAKSGSETPVTSETQTYTTHYKSKLEAGKFLAYSSEKKSKLPVFQTPLNPVSQKGTTSSIKRTPLKTNAAYDHVSSPVASYIKNCSQSPLVRNIDVNNPNSGQTSTPKFVKTTQQSKCNLTNKENVNLPVGAYKMAKKVKLVNVPSTKKLPESDWAEKNALPKAKVIKHEHRENITKKKLQGEMSMDLTLDQAEISHCIQKVAVYKP